MGFWEIFGICVAFAFIVGLLIWIIIDTKNVNIVLEKSERIKTLQHLNTKTYFSSTMRSTYTNLHACNSKRQLENLTMEDYLISLIDSNESFYRSLLQTISSNKTKYDEYIKQVSTIKSSATIEFCKSIGLSYKKFLSYEERLFNREILQKPQMDVTIYCKATYTSPQGRNHYWKERSFSYSELESIFNRTMQLKSEKQTRQYQISVERSKMTDSLRYDILKRDGFRCQICGSTAQDGVKLHVDHIIPVSKGGKTIPSNLRTLCDRCNLGKSDKM